jgi:hypothetical protein
MILMEENVVLAYVVLKCRVVLNAEAGGTRQ